MNGSLYLLNKIFLFCPGICKAYQASLSFKSVSQLWIQLCWCPSHSIMIGRVRSVRWLFNTLYFLVKPLTICCLWEAQSVFLSTLHCCLYEAFGKLSYPLQSLTANTRQFASLPQCYPILTFCVKGCLMDHLAVSIQYRYLGLDIWDLTGCNTYRYFLFYNKSLHIAIRLVRLY